MEADYALAQFVAEVILLLLVGRLTGELLNRFGQPAIFGQLIAGVILGPSVFGALAPAAHHAIFPDTPKLKAMIDALSQTGILLLLLLTGMETNLSLLRKSQRVVISTSLAGIAVPFACGVALAFRLPDRLIPNPDARLITALFLGIAMSVSSIKIVAMVLMEIGAIRRDLGQLILATAILDDTIAWVLISVIAGFAAHGAVSLSSALLSVGGALVFLALSLTIGRRIVARVIRFTNDRFSTEVPVVTAILVIMLAMALTTELIGVHTALGAFVAGVLIGQSPILTDHIDSQLRGFILAFFSPIFFAVAGLGMDVSTLADVTLLWLTLAIILIASIGKFIGAALGGRIGGLTGREALALATGLNARGSTEVIVASIGLSMGALSNALYTMIVAMAIITTMAMPPTLRAFLRRVPPREAEVKRLEKEEAEERQSVPKMERALVTIEDGRNGAMAAALAGVFAAGQRVLTTLMEPVIETEQDSRVASRNYEVLLRSAAAAFARSSAQSEDADAKSKLKPSELVETKAGTNDAAIREEAAKGYSLVFAGFDQKPDDVSHRFGGQLQQLVDSFTGPVAIALNGERFDATPGRPLNILVPTAGAPHARLATEIALALAKASGGRLTVLHVFDPADEAEALRTRARRFGMSVLVDARALGKRNNVRVEALTATDSRPDAAMRRVIGNRHFDLVVIGAVLRVGERKFLGPRSSALVRAIRQPCLLIAR